MQLPGEISQRRTVDGEPAAVAAPEGSLDARAVEIAARRQQPARGQAREHDRGESHDHQDDDGDGPLHAKRPDCYGLFRTSVALTVPGWPAVSIVALSICTPFCWLKRASQPTRASKGAFSNC